LLSEPEFYELHQQASAEWVAERRRVPLTRPEDYLELTLVSDRFDQTAQPMSLICGDREFSRLEHGARLYEVTAGYLRSLREGSANYPIYLTSLRFSGLHSLRAPSTVELLALKKRVEQRLNRAP
jgi:adenylate cyclase class 1